MKEWVFGCPTCSEDVTFVGDLNEASGECKICGTVTVCPDEIFYHEEAERRGDYIRDEGY